LVNSVFLRFQNAGLRAPTTSSSSRNPHNTHRRIRRADEGLVADGFVFSSASSLTRDFPRLAHDGGPQVRAFSPVPDGEHDGIRAVNLQKVTPIQCRALATKISRAKLALALPWSAASPMVPERG